MSGVPLKCIYTRWIAVKLVEQGFKIVRVGVNEWHPQYETYFFYYTPEFKAALDAITKSKSKSKFGK